MSRIYKLPETLRPKLAKPMGRLFRTTEVGGKEFSDALIAAPMVVTVGDRVTETVGALGRVPDVQVIDSKENRKERLPPAVVYSRKISVKNPPGTITEEAIGGIREAFRGRKPVRVSVEGEEDLLAIPVIALAPVSALVVYGQPGEGVVAVRADAESKSRNRAVLAELGISELR